MPIGFKKSFKKGKRDFLSCLQIIQQNDTSTLFWQTGRQLERSNSGLSSYRLVRNDRLFAQGIIIIIIIIIIIVQLALQVPQFSSDRTLSIAVFCPHLYLAIRCHGTNTKRKHLLQNITKHLYCKTKP